VYYTLIQDISFEKPLQSSISTISDTQQTRDMQSNKSIETAFKDSGSAYCQFRIPTSPSPFPSSLSLSPEYTFGRMACVFLRHPRNPHNLKIHNRLDGPMRHLPRIILRAAPRVRCIECAFYDMARRRTWLIPLSEERPVEIDGCEFMVLQLHYAPIKSLLLPLSFRLFEPRGQ
jgi:hypothetical protein